MLLLLLLLQLGPVSVGNVFPLFAGKEEGDVDYPIPMPPCPKPDMVVMSWTLALLASWFILMAITIIGVMSCPRQCFGIFPVPGAFQTIRSYPCIFSAMSTHKQHYELLRQANEVQEEQVAMMFQKNKVLRERTEAALREMEALRRENILQQRAIEYHETLRQESQTLHEENVTLYQEIVALFQQKEMLHQEMETLSLAATTDDAATAITAAASTTTLTSRHPHDDSRDI
uniref:Uncharacterized protein LOC116944641 n=1 Tax=Petromyzon marinus TaxID=7757 RepID=A0AAJ7WZB3_PETMA|nr:uncharacterized protein LOC116944641 [Petromyzon marinus]